MWDTWLNPVPAVKSLDEDCNTPTPATAGEKMSAALPPMVNRRWLLAIKSKERVAKGIEQMRCRAVRFARGDGKFAANAVTPLQYALLPH